MVQPAEEHNQRQTPEDVLRQARISHGTNMTFHISSTFNAPPKASMVRLQFENDMILPYEDAGQDMGPSAVRPTRALQAPSKQPTVKPLPRFGSVTMAAAASTSTAASASAAEAAFRSTGLACGANGRLMLSDVTPDGAAPDAHLWDGANDTCVPADAAECAGPTNFAPTRFVWTSPANLEPQTGSLTGSCAQAAAMLSGPLTDDAYAAIKRGRQRRMSATEVPAPMLYTSRTPDFMMVSIDGYVPAVAASGPQSQGANAAMSATRGGDSGRSSTHVARRASTSSSCCTSPVAAMRGEPPQRGRVGGAAHLLQAVGCDVMAAAAAGGWALDAGAKGHLSAASARGGAGSSGRICLRTSSTCGSCDGGADPDPTSVLRSGGSFSTCSSHNSTQPMPMPQLPRSLQLPLHQQQHPPQQHPQHQAEATAGVNGLALKPTPLCLSPQSTASVHSPHSSSPLTAVPSLIYSAAATAAATACASPPWEGPNSAGCVSRSHAGCNLATQHGVPAGGSGAMSSPGGWVTSPGTLALLQQQQQQQQQVGSPGMALLTKVSRAPSRQAPEQEWTLEKLPTAAEAAHAANFAGAGGAGAGCGYMSSCSFGRGYSPYVNKSFQAATAVGARVGTLDGGVAGVAGGSSWGSGTGTDGDGGPRSFGSDATASACGEAGGGRWQQGSGLGSAVSDRELAAIQEPTSPFVNASVAEVASPSGLLSSRGPIPRQPLAVSVPWMAGSGCSGGGGANPAPNVLLPSSRRSSLSCDDRPPPSPPSQSLRSPQHPQPLHRPSSNAGLYAPQPTSLHVALHQQQQHQQHKQHRHHEGRHPQQLKAFREAGLVGPDEPAGMSPVPPTTCPAAADAGANRRPRFSQLGLGSSAKLSQLSYGGAAPTEVKAPAPAKGGAAGGHSRATEARSGVRESLSGQISTEEHLDIMARMKKALSFLRKGD